MPTVKPILHWKPKAIALLAILTYLLGQFMVHNEIVPAGQWEILVPIILNSAGLLVVRQDNK